MGHDMLTGTLCECDKKNGLYVYITKIFEFEYDRFYRFLCNFKEYS